jgi:hypothetical protein
MLVLRMAIGLFVLNLGYGFEGSFTPLKNFHFVSDLFTGESVPVSLRETVPHAAREDYTTNRFAGSWLGELPVPFPKNYLLGIDIQQNDFKYYGRPAYLRGKWRDDGWWYYYLYACAIKVPLALWVLAIVMIVDRIINGFTLRQNCRDELVLLFPAIVIFAFVSSQTGINEHMRYVLTAFPYFFIWVSKIAGGCLFLPGGRHATRFLTD